MRRLAAALAALILAGCAAVPQSTAPAAHSDSEALLAYFERVRQLPAADLAREKETARRALTGEPSDIHRMRYVLALAVPGSPPADTAKALEIVEPVARNRAAPLHGLAAMLRALLADLHRSDSELADTRRKLDSLMAIEKNLSGRSGGNR